MKLSAAVDATTASARIAELRERLGPWRRDVVRDVARRVLAETAERNPIDTGRSRAAWVAGLEPLGGTAAPSWPGDSPDASAISEGTQSVDATESESRHISASSVTNSVDYVHFLEYGTRSMRPFAMVRRSLADAGRHLVGALGRLLSRRN